MSAVTDAITGLVEIGKAMGVTLKAFVTKPITVQYPEEKIEIFPRFRARHILQRYENGLEKCVGCGLCAAVCPARAIFVEAAENTEEHRVSPGERYAGRYEINMIRCIFCGYCQEACPEEAIVLGHDFALSEYDRDAQVYTKDRLLVPPAAHVIVKPDKVQE